MSDNYLPIHMKYLAKVEFVNVTRRDTTSICIFMHFTYMITHVHPEHIISELFITIRCILLHNKGLWLSRWHFMIIFYILFLDPMIIAKA